MYSLEIVLKALDFYNKYNSYNKTAIMLNMYRQTITNWIKKYRYNLIKLNDRVITNIKRKFNLDIKYDFNNIDILTFIKNTIKNTPFLTKNEMRLKIIKKFDIKLSNKKLSFIYKKINLTRKKVKKRICKDEKFIDNLVEERNKFIKKINTIDKNKIISIDETGISNVLNNLFGYSEKGIDINIPITNKKNKNQSIIIALTTNGIIHYDINEENTDNKLFMDFIIKVIEKLKEKNYVFIFDNVKFHKNKETLDLISNNGHQYIFIPSYSPDLNPIENVNGIIKQTINKLIINDVLNNTDDNINNVNNDDSIKNKIKEKRINKNIKLIEEKIKIKNENKAIMKEKLNDKKITKEIKKEIKIKYKNEILNKIKIKKKELNDNIKKEISLLKNKMILSYIKKSIDNFNEKYKIEKIEKIYVHAFTYNYELIKKELKDRIIFTKII